MDLLLLKACFSLGSSSVRLDWQRDMPDKLADLFTEGLKALTLLIQASNELLSARDQRYSVDITE